VPLQPPELLLELQLVALLPALQPPPELLLPQPELAQLLLQSLWLLWLLWLLWHLDQAVTLPMGMGMGIKYLFC